MVPFINIYKSVFSPFLQFRQNFLCFLHQLKFNTKPRRSSNKLVMKILPLHHMPNHFVLCDGAGNFAVCSAGAERRREQQCAGLTTCPVICISLFPAGPRSTSNLLHCRKQHWWLHFTSNRCISSVLLLMCPPPRAAAKISNKKSRSHHASERLQTSLQKTEQGILK